MSTSLYDFSAQDIHGKPIDFSVYTNKVVLIVNTASACGFTPQYAELETLYQRHQDQGFVILGFPCNQFGAQESGNNSEIAAFCETRFNITFPMFGKIDVNGENAHPLFQWLTHNAKGILGSEKIKWNFTKFLINRQGQVIKRFAPLTSPNKLISAIEQSLGGTNKHQ